MNKYLFLFLSLFLFSCQTENKLLPRYTGSAGEIVVIINGNVWSSDLGESIRTFFEQAVPHLPQPEARFYLGQYEPSGFNNLLRQHRNILFVDISDKHAKSEVNLIRSKWSKDQVVVHIKALNTAEALELFSAKKQAIIDLYDKAEIQRLQDKFNRKTNLEVVDSLKKEFNISLQLPEDMLLAVGRTDDAVWLKQDRVKYLSGVGHDISQGLVIYQFPYTSDSTFTNKYAVAARNKAVQVVSSDGKNRYMSSEMEFYPPEGELISFNGKSAWYSTGLWNMQGDFMGGPFVNILILDEKNQRIIGVDGYVFAPKFNKREYLREVSAMLKSVTLLD
jgi:hypothetical protein